MFCQSVMWDLRIQCGIPRCTTDFTCDIRGPLISLCLILTSGKKSMCISQYILMSKIYYKTKGKRVLTCNLWKCPKDLGNEKFREKKEMWNWRHRSVPQFMFLRRADRKDTMIPQSFMKAMPNCFCKSKFSQTLLSWED